jgi:endoglucanase
LSDECGQPVTLRGQGFGWDNWWPQYYNANVVAWLNQDWCVDVVRPAMGIEPEGGYLENSAASRGRIQEVVEAAIAEDIYVIIDWHAHDLHQSEAVTFFSDMAQAYGDQPNVVYEVFNEPEEETWPEVKSYAEAVIAAIRQHDPDNVVIVGNPEWDQRIDLVAQDPIDSDPNIVYSLHFYAATHGQWLRDRATEAMAAGVPIFVSESSGSEASGLGANDYTEWEAWFDFMETNQISWINYSISDKEGETISVLEPGAPANGGWDASQLTETGEYIRDVLRAHCD